MATKAGDRRPARRYQYVGRVEEVRGLTVLASGLPLAIGEMVDLHTQSAAPIEAEVVGFLPDHRTYLMPFDEMRGVFPGAPVVSRGAYPTVPTGRWVLGRVIDGRGHPLDGGREILGPRRRLDPPPTSPLAKRPVREMLPTGVRTVDGLLTLGRGQRMGIFAGAGVGKTTLLHMLLAGSRADVSVVALVGERGREVAGFWEALTAETRARTVVVAATSASPALMRLKAAEAAMTIAEDFRDRGLDVLFVCDSLTRVAMAQREVGLEAGEIASVRGYTPSVFHLLPRLLERAGNAPRGSITGLYTVLLDGDDPTDPIGDAVRGILDGHIYLARRLAEAHHFPAIDVPRSLSRVMPDLVSPEHFELQRLAGEALAELERSRDLVSLGAYEAGSNPALDYALAIERDLYAWLDQAFDEASPLDKTLARLSGILGGERVAENG